MNESKRITVKASKRGYAYLGKLEGAPDFKKLTHATRNGEAGTPIQEIVINGEKKATSMIRRGYVAIGPNVEAEVEFAVDRVTITPVVEA
jgi:hypothetical protein